MEIVYGNLYTYDEMKKYNYVGFTANSVIKKDGSLVMGAGNAKVVRDLFQGIDKTFGREIKGKRIFNVMFVKGIKIFALQTKINYQDNSDIDLVEESIKQFGEIAKRNENKTFACPCPAIGYGGLKEEDIMYLLNEYLPKNVFIYKLRK